MGNSGEPCKEFSSKEKKESNGEKREGKKRRERREEEKERNLLHSRSLSEQQTNEHLCKKQNDQHNLAKPR